MTGMGDDMGGGSTVDAPGAVVPNAADVAEARAARAAFRTARCGLCLVIAPDAALCEQCTGCLLYTSPSPRDGATSRMPSSA